MSVRPQVLVADDGERRKGMGSLPPSSLLGLVPLFMTAGLVLSIAGWVNVAFFYYPSRFGEAEWEFGTLAQTFDAMPLPTLGAVLVALAIRARGGSIAWSRGMAVIFAVIALFCITAIVLLTLDVPLALTAMQRAAAQANQQGALISSGLKRGLFKAFLYAVCYAVAYGWMAVTMWRRSDSGQVSFPPPP